MYKCRREQAGRVTGDREGGRERKSEREKESGRGIDHYGIKRETL